MGTAGLQPAKKSNRLEISKIVDRNSDKYKNKGTEKMNIKQIPGYDGYAASDEGCIYKINDNGSYVELEQYETKWKVPMCYFEECDCRHSVAKLVAITFVPKPDDGRKYRPTHIDGSKSNNRADNLKWVVDYFPTAEEAERKKTLSELDLLSPKMFVGSDGRNYMVSQKGRVYLFPEMIEVEYRNDEGSLLFRDTMSNWLRVDVAVYRSFLGEATSYTPIKHINGNGLDCSASNLAIDSDSYYGEIAITSARKPEKKNTSIYNPDKCIVFHKVQEDVFETEDDTYKGLPIRLVVVRSEEDTFHVDIFAGNEVVSRTREYKGKVSKSLTKYASKKIRKALKTKKVIIIHMK